MPTNYWLLVSTPENFEISRRRGFDLAAMKSRHERKARQVRSGDKVIFYLTREMAIAGIAEVKSAYFTSEEPIWHSEKPGETYPFRFQTTPELILPPGELLPVEPFVGDLTHARKWPPEHWRLAFQGNVHLLLEEDFILIERRLRARLEQSAGAVRQ